MWLSVSIALLSLSVSNTWQSLSPLNAIHCPTYDYFPLKILHHVTPRGNSSAGVYTKHLQHKTIGACTQSCCLSPACHLVFFYNQSCFHLRCHSSQACQLIRRTGPKFAHSDIVLVRSVDDIFNSADDYSEIYNDGDTDYPKRRREDRVVSINSSPDTTVDDEDYVPSSQETQSTSPSLLVISDTICTIGLNECPKYEMCHLTNRRRREGICICRKGYVRDEQKQCQPVDTRPTEVVVDAAEGEPESSLHASKSGNIQVDNSLMDMNVSSTPVSLTHLVVSAGPNQTIELPKDDATLSVFVLPSSSTYKYEWQLLSHPITGDNDFGNMQGSNTANLKLSHLRAGNYTFKVIVTGDNAIGSTEINVIVLPPRRVNKPPVAVIQPANSTVQLPNKETVLDGSYSTDDDKIVKYEWQAMTLPIAYKNLQLPSSQTLQLHDLLPGLYQLRLTVTDSDGANSSTIANITVLKEIDYPPTANAGPDVVIHLPQNEVTLYGNQSTDDKGIMVWQWTRVPDTESGVDSTAVDMDGTSTPILHLSKLEVGVYKFVLKVTDTANQSSAAEVHVFVKPENNEPPVANAGDSFKVTLPLEHDLVLDGSHSHDDVGITKWLWEQIKGPKEVTIVDSDRFKANISKLFPGDYAFRLTVWDAKDANSSSEIAVNVIQAKNMPPIANAGGDKIITLPVDEVVLNGSKSSDDVEIVSYLWVRMPESLAFGDIIGNSSYSPVLRLSNLITGRYLFRLTVTDGQGVSASDVASLIVKPSIDIVDHIEIVLNSDIKSFTVDQQMNVLKRIELLLNEGESIKVQLIRLDSTTHTRRVVMVFIVINASGKRIAGRDVVKHLKQKLKTDSSLITPEVISLETTICQNECSGHGTCDQYTKRCLCEAFWMEDAIRLYLGDNESNCDWSILYVIVISFTAVTTLTALFWACVCCVTKLNSSGKRSSKLSRNRYRKSNRNRYTLLEDDPYGNDITAVDRIELLSNNVKQLNSETYFSDESVSDTLFDSTVQRNNILNNKLNANTNSQQKFHQKSLNGLVKDNRKVRA